MRKSEQELLHEVAISEFKERWLWGLLWLLFMTGVVAFSAYGIFRAIAG